CGAHPWCTQSALYREPRRTWPIQNVRCARRQISDPPSGRTSSPRHRLLRIRSHCMSYSSVYGARRASRSRSLCGLVERVVPFRSTANPELLSVGDQRFVLTEAVSKAQKDIFCGWRSSLSQSIDSSHLAWFNASDDATATEYGGSGFEPARS